MELNNRKLFERAIRRWGAKAQLEMLQEEATELALATRKATRNGMHVFELEDLAGEIADVLIMLDQLKLIVPSESRLNDLIKEKTEFKLRRLKNKLDRADADEELGVISW